MRSRIPRLALAAVSLALSLLAAEAFFRLVRFDFDRQEAALAEVPIFWQQPRVPLGEIYFRRAGPATWTGMMPTSAEPVTIDYDEQGFRNPRAMSDWEIVVVGDSFVESGYLPQEEIFTSVLGRLVGARVKNLGVSHTGPLTHIYYLDRFGRAPSARLAVLAFFEGNDLDDLKLEFAALARWRQTGEREYRRIVPQSSLFRALGDWLDELGKERVPAAAPDPVWQGNAVLSLPGSGRSERVKIFYPYLPPWRAELPPARVRRLGRVIGHWGTKAREMGLDPWLLYLPCKRRVLDPWIEFDPGTPPRVAAWRPTDLPSLLAELAEANGVGFIDATGALSVASASGELVFNRIDSHLSAAGSRVVAESLAAALPRLPSGRRAPAK